MREIEPRLLNRREALRRISAGALLAAGCWPGVLAAAGRSRSLGGTFRFVVVNDTHTLDEACAPWLARVVQRIAAEKPEFCVVAGDCANDGTAAQLTIFRDAFRKLKAPLHVQIGNHDYAAPADRGPYERLFKKQINYRFEHRGWQFVALDTTEGQKYEQTRIQPATFQWCDENLRRLDPERPTVVCTHFPLGEQVTYRPLNADDLLDRFRDLNLQAVFSGHFHGFTERQRGRATLTTNCCCALQRGNHDGTKAKGFFVCEAAEGKVTRRFVEVQPG